ncbi:ferredoxin--NADP reductase 1 [Halobacillus andaensis]|uniref:Ferredoxin--NADP reductase n=1 Tax=Halobacillus andaensis TaxID=1176239 RepID=A0A917BE64_HALAA|nr:NAD(P)/FAD-dependent oxidoreductase [Halobacillus andaensis]MBP2006332.1 thioredoxin reductase (NADPH) [Halobacillus andaensis]GGF34321.1 ferredoxin--NADP reductase 1 [Halobacillus andaensis]
MNDEQFDLTIIGGGTTGLYTAFYAGMRDMKTKVIEYQPGLGGKVSFFYPEKKIYDVGGFPGVSGEELVSNVEKQALSVEPTIVTREKISSIEKLDDGSFLLTSGCGGRHYSKTIIIASGLGTFDMEPIQLPGSNLYQSNIHCTIQKIKQYEGKKAAVLSDSRVGVDWALALEGVAAEVYLINHGTEFKAVYEHDIDKLEASTVNVYRETNAVEMKGSDNKLSELVLDSGKRLEVNDLLVYQGLKIEKGKYEKWGITTEKGRIPVGEDMSTNIDGIFAAGDAAIYPHKTMLIASGFSEAMTAVNSAKQAIDPKAKSQVYSTVIYKHS